MLKVYNIVQGLIIFANKFCKLQHHASDEDGKTQIYWAARHEHKDIVKILEYNLSKFLTNRMLENQHSRN